MRLVRFVIASLLSACGSDAATCTSRPIAYQVEAVVPLASFTSSNHGTPLIWSRRAPGP